MNVPENIMAAIRRDNPIEMDGLTFYPVLMEDYEKFNTARMCLELAQQKLPVQYVTMPYISAAYALDFDLTVAGETPSGLFAACLRLLALSLRIGTGQPIAAMTGKFKVYADKNDPRTLSKITFLVNGEELHSITPLQFNRYRPILAAQNAVEVPDEADNADILEAENILQEKKSLSLDINIDDAISSVAVVAGIDESEIYGWTIRKFSARRKAVDRILNFMVCGIGELGGMVKWKGGNPVPSWCFDRKKGNSPALISASEFIGSQKGAVAQRNS